MRIGETLYLDYQASTPLDPRVSAVMREAEQSLFANPHASDHILGWRAAAAINKAAGQVGALLDMDAIDVVFTSGASEANAMVLKAATRIAGETGRTHVIISEGDHSSIRNEALHCGLSADTVPLTPNGEPDMSALKVLVSEQTILVSLIGVSNESGAITDLSEAARICEAAGTYFHADLSQAPLALDLNMFELGLSYATLSSHKIYGPKGIGALVSTPIASRWLAPLIFGGGQQNGRRGGTLPTELCLGFGQACELLRSEGVGERNRVASLRDSFVSHLETRGLAMLVGARAMRHPGNALMRFPGIEAGDLLSRLQPFLAASSQSACASGSIEPSKVIQAMGLTRREASECIRFSFGRFSDEGQISDAIQAVEAAISEAQA